MVREHGLSERTNDLDAILPTVSAWDQHFALLGSGPDGKPDLRLALDPEAVRDFYVDRVNAWRLKTSYGQSDLLARWYKLVDTRGEYTSVATGETQINHVAVLFPTWTDGIIGEIMWTEPEWAPGHLDQDQYVEIGLRLDDHDAAWRAGDVDARLATVEDRTCSVIRVAEVDGDRRQLTVARSKPELGAAWSSPSAGRVTEFERLNRITTSSYVFASYRLVLELPDRKVEREVAALLPLGPNRKFVGELSYAFEVSL